MTEIPTNDETEAMVAEVLREQAEEPPISDAKARRFYDRMRRIINESMEKRGKALGKTQDYLFLAPDVFMLLVRLVRDPRVSGKHKVMLGTGVAYYVFPLDLMPELLLGPIGFLDDLILGVYILNRMLVDTDEEILREHWSGRGDLLAAMRKVLKSADGLVASDVVKAIKKMVG